MTQIDHILIEYVIIFFDVKRKMLIFMEVFYLTQNEYSPSERKSIVCYR